jgi:hypothetical protein
MIEEKVVPKEKKEIRVMLLGCLSNPKIKCLKELYHEVG